MADLPNMYSINENHMMYCFWDMERGKENFCFFWAIFCPFTPLTTQKIRILKKWKRRSGDIIILHKCTTNDNPMIYGSWDMKRDRHNFLSFCHFLHVYPTNYPQNQKLWKHENKRPKILSFHTGYHKWKSYDIWFLRYGTRQTVFLVILGQFLLLCPRTRKIQILKK